MEAEGESSGSRRRRGTKALDLTAKNQEKGGAKP